MPGSLRSAVYFARPVTLSSASTRGSRWPTTTVSTIFTLHLVAPRCAAESFSCLDSLVVLPCREPLAGRQHRLDDLLIAGAPAELARERKPDLLARWSRVRVQQCLGREDHPGRADAALQAAVPHELLLQRMQTTVTREPLDCREFPPLRGHGEREARGDRLAVHEYRARAAVAGCTPFLCPG